jgi:acyl-CoA dehydrogenase
MFMLVRTRAEGKPQAGITFLLVDMTSPGITVRPIISMSGDHEINQVFFDGVRAPQSNRVGAENEGWTVAKYLLEFERGGFYAARIRALLRRVKAMAAATEAEGGALIDAPGFRRRLIDLELEIAAVDSAEHRVLSNMAVGRNLGDSTASMLKLRGSETMQKASELALEAVGVFAAPYQRDAVAGRGSAVGPEFAATPTAQYLNGRASSIFGGSSEIQRNILARSVLAV